MAADSEIVGRIPASKKGNTKPDAKRRPARTLPTTRVGFTKQLQLLRTFAELGTTEKAATTGEVSKVVGIHPGTTAYAMPFLADVFLQKVGTGYMPRPEVIAYHRAMAWNADTAGQKMAPVLRQTWFARALLPKLALNSMAEPEAVAELAQEAAVGKDFSGSLTLLLDYLGVSGLVRREGGMVYAGNAVVEEPVTRPETEAGSQQESGISKPRPATIATAFAQAPEGVLRFNVDVSVDMTEFAKWTPDRISAFWAGIADVLAAKADIEREGKKR